MFYKLDEIPLLEDEDECSWLPYQIGSPEYIPGSERFRAEKDIFFVPSMFEGINFRENLELINYIVKFC